MSILTDLRDRFIVAPVAKRITEEFTKAQEKQPEIQAWTQPLGFNTQPLYNRRPTNAITYEMLRNMATYHEISRACINIRKREITQLEWDITPRDEKQSKKYTKETAILKAWFSTIGGYNIKMRRLLDLIVEDYLVIDAISLYRRRTRGGALLGLIPVDPTTIKILVTEEGLTPPPPAIAYEQWIRGAKTGELTNDDLIYDMLNPRSNTPYGFSVMEALVLTIEAAIKTSLYNVNYFTDGNVPEGFYELPQEWTVDQIKQFQEHYDAMVAGDSQKQRRIKFMPASGKGYQPAKSFQFDGVRPYLEWLTKVTASLFGVMPQELGFTETVNKATGEEQTEVAKRNSIRPMANAIEEIFNEILGKEEIAITDSKGTVIETMGPYPELQFRFMGIDAKDDLKDAEIHAKLIPLGAVGVDEWRKEHGKEPLGIPPYVQTPSGPVPIVEQLLSPKEEEPKTETIPTVETPPADPGDAASSQDQEDAMNSGPQKQSEKADLKLWEKKALRDFKEGRSFRKFSSEVIPDFMRIEIEKQLSQCKDKEAIKKVFGYYNKVVEEGVLNDAERLLQRLDSLED